MSLYFTIECFDQAIQCICATRVSIARNSNSSKILIKTHLFNTVMKWRFGSISEQSIGPPRRLLRGRWRNKCQLHYITSHHITSHHITSHHTTPHHTTPHHITSHHITSHHITSHHITSHHITSHHITSHHITSHHITSHHITSHHITSHYITLHYITLHYITLHYITLHCWLCHSCSLSSFACSLNPIRQTFIPQPLIPLLYNPFTIVLLKSLWAYLFRAAHTPACWIGTKRNKDFHPHRAVQDSGLGCYIDNVNFGILMQMTLYCCLPRYIICS